MNTSPEGHDISILAKNLKMLILDVDGVMTDGGIVLSGGTEEWKRFNVQDGMGITLAKSVGLKIAIITSRESRVVRRRALELNIDELCQGVRVKTEALEQILFKHRMQGVETGYVGDDIQDIPIMKLVGLPMAVGNARPEVKACSKYVTSALGGHGAVREIIDWLLDLRGEREMAFDRVIS